MALIDELKKRHDEFREQLKAVERREEELCHELADLDIAIAALEMEAEVSAESAEREAISALDPVPSPPDESSPQASETDYPQIERTPYAVHFTMKDGGFGSSNYETLAEAEQHFDLLCNDPATKTAEMKDWYGDTATWELRASYEAHPDAERPSVVTDQDRVEPLLDPQSPSITSEVRTQAEDVIAAMEAGRLLSAEGEPRPLDDYHPDLAYTREAQAAWDEEEQYKAHLAELKAQPDPADLPPPSDAEFNAMEKLDVDPRDSQALALFMELVGATRHDGGPCPVEVGCHLEIFTRGCREWPVKNIEEVASHWTWAEATPHPTDIIAYRVVDAKPAPVVSELDPQAEGTGDRVEQEKFEAHKHGGEAGFWASRLFGKPKVEA